MIVETMAEDDSGMIQLKNMGGLSLGYGVAKARLSDIIQGAIELGLFQENDGKIFSNRMLKHKEFRKELSEASQFVLWAKTGCAIRRKRTRYLNRRMTFFLIR